MTENIKSEDKNDPLGFPSDKCQSVAHFPAPSDC
jgi:hypothetical protein